MKRIFQKISAISFFVVFISTAFGQNKPNILWITFEDTSPEFIGMYGNPNAKTPVMDKLGAEGVRFTSAFATGTVCSPSRTTLITGVRVFENGTGHHRSGNQIPESMHGFPFYMKEAGYFTSNNVKMDYNVSDVKAFAAKAWDENSNKAGWEGRKPGQPFFAVFNFMDSHQSRTMTNSYEKYKELVLDQLKPEERIAETAFEMPPIYRDSPEMRKQFARVYNSLKLTDNMIGKLLEKLERDGLRDSTIIFLFSDHGEGMPRGKTNGIDLGYRIAFAAWFPPMYKHLSPWGEGVVTDELVSFEDFAPTMISLAGGKIPYHMKGRVFAGSNPSKAPKFIELSSDRSDNGVDMVRSITDGRYMYSRNYMPFMPEMRYINYMEVGDIKQQIRIDHAGGKLNSIQRSFLEPRAPERLVDTKTDPWELNNLADKTSGKARLKKMRRVLDERVLSSRDVMFLPEYEMVEISAKTNLYEYRLTDAAYPIKEIYETAKLAGFCSAQTAKKQASRLASSNNIVRYWAVLGMRSQNAANLMPFKDQLLKLVNDPYPPVAITASAICHDLFGDLKATEQLKSFAGDKNPHLALLASNYLIYAKNKAPFEARIKNLNNGNPVYFVKWAYEDFLSALSGTKQ